jgi:hypothetical protein
MLCFEKKLLCYFEQLKNIQKDNLADPRGGGGWRKW